METGRLKIFATEARVKLMQGVKRRLQALGFDLATGEAKEMPQRLEGGAVLMGTIVSETFYEQWMSLYRNVQARSIREVAEEAAYTWFNRLMAIRIMSKHGFISPILDYEDDFVRVPLIVAEARQGRVPMMSDAEHTRLMELLDDDSRTAEQFTILIVAFCHDNPIINRCFGKIADYTELLLPQDILADGGFMDMINHSTFITDEQYGSAELIGWLYQFYIADRKDEAFAKSGKYAPDDIAPATQIFTPNWIVKYMVQNTVGRICMFSRLATNELIDTWKYFLTPTTVHQPLITMLMDSLQCEELEQLKVADLACGSGHILNECFDLLYDVYIENGYSRRDAIENIFAKNLLGIDLDTRAKQLATFSLLMKACRNDQSFLDAHAMPRVYDMPRPFTETMRKWLHGETEADEVKPLISGMFSHYLMGGTQQMKQELADAVWLMNHADTLGSIMKFNLSETTRNALMVRTAEYEELLAKGDIIPEPTKLAMQYAYIILALTDKYSAICMNPPYMGSGRFDTVLSKYVKDNYKDSKADLFAVFMQVAIDRLADKGKYGMINMHSWMFLSSFESLRHTVLKEQTIDSLLHLGPHTFDELNGEVVQNAAFVITKQSPQYTGHFSDPDHPEIPSCQAICTRSADYFRLVDGRDCADKEHMFIDAIANKTKGVYYEEIYQSNFEKIPGSTIGYWVTNNILKCFEHKTIAEISISDGQTKTGDNNKYLRFLWEVSYKSVGKENKWVKHPKGGSYRRWYGNVEWVIDWSKEARSFYRKDRVARILPEYLWWRKGISWTLLTSGLQGYRDYQDDCIFNLAAPTLFFDDEEDRVYVLGLLNSPISIKLISLFNPTLNNNIGDIQSIPFIKNNVLTITSLVKQNIYISKTDWDAHETSCDFKGNELVDMSADKYIDIMKNYGDWIGAMVDLAPPQLESLQWRVDVFHTKWKIQYERLQANEEELNRQFIEIYGLQDELTPDVPLNEVSILQQGEISIKDDEIVWNDGVLIKQLISYAVGCMMGRYSIDKPGLILANQGDGLKEYEAQVPTSRFEVDDDGIIPLMPSDTWFNDNATLRFKRFVATVFGEETLNENLNFIEQSLGKSIDSYFVKDFWKDHKKMYQNRPIYWLFSSKKGAFQCLVYMHRMNAYTAERIRSKYLLPHIDWLVQRAQDLEDMPLLNTQDRRTLDNLHSQIAECREYHDRLHVIADRQIDFDLDDGVVVNYAKFGDTLAKLK